jgi:hypothetical protein
VLGSGLGSCVLHGWGVWTCGHVLVDVGWLG